MSKREIKTAHSFMKWEGASIIYDEGEALAESLLLVANDLKQKSGERAPVDTGDLRGNCSVTVESIKKLRVGYSLPYALKQHEALEYNHERGGEAKFLENPYNENKDDYFRSIRSRVKKAIERGQI